MNKKHTTQSFRDKLFEVTLEDYKRHWKRWGYDSDDPQSWCIKNRVKLVDQPWIHQLMNHYENHLFSGLGDNYDSEFFDFIQKEVYRYISNGELSHFINLEMNEFVFHRI